MCATRWMAVLLLSGALVAVGCNQDSGSGDTSTSGSSSSSASAYPSSSGGGDGDGDYGNSGQGGYGDAAQGGYGDTDQGGYGGYGDTDQGGYGDTGQGGSGDSGQDGYGGYGDTSQGGYGNAGQGGDSGYGDTGQSGYGYGYGDGAGQTQQGQGGYGQGGYGQGGYGQGGGSGPVVPGEAGAGSGPGGGYDAYAEQSGGYSSGPGGNPAGGGYGDGNGDTGQAGYGAAGQSAEPARPRSWEELAAERFRRAENREAFRYLYAHLVGTDAGRKELAGHFGWVPGLKRPALAIRWGLAVQYRAGSYEGNPHPIGAGEQQLGGAAGGRSQDGGYGQGGYGDGGYGDGGYRQGGAGQPGSDANWDPGENGRSRLFAYTGELGDKIVDRLEARLQRGYFGELLKARVMESAGSGSQDGFGGDGFGGPYGDGGYGYGAQGTGYDSGYGAADGGWGALEEGTGSDPDEPRGVLPGIVMLGVGSRDQLLQHAKAEGLDVLVLFDVAPRYNVRGNIVQTDTSIQLLDVQKAQQLHKSRSLNNTKIQFQRQRSPNAPDPVDVELDLLFAVVDEQLKVEEFPEQLTPVIARRRVDYLGEQETENPLAVIGEMLMYRQRKLVSDPELHKGLSQLVGAGASRTLIQGKEAQRKEVLQQWLPADAGPPSQTVGDPQQGFFTTPAERAPAQPALKPL